MDSNKITTLEPLEKAISRLDENLAEAESNILDSFDKLEQALNQHEEALLSGNQETLSVLAQEMLFQLADRCDSIVASGTQSHKDLHGSISRIGKTIEKTVSRETNPLLKNEQDLEADPAAAHATDQLLANYFSCSGYPDVAASLSKDFDLTTSTSPATEPSQQAIVALEKHDVEPAVEWLEKNAPHEDHLKFDLLRQVAIEHVREGNTNAAILQTRKLANMGYEKDVQRVYGAIIMGPNSPRYSDIYKSNNWRALLARFSQVVLQTENLLEDLLETGTRTVVALTNIRRKLSQRREFVVTDELPCTVDIKRQVHNCFTCPILRQQSTENNPPMKLVCGHVISRDALNNLSKASRQNRLKCPYCPSEASMQDAVRVYF